MDYYCYISQSKIDQFIDEIGEDNPLEYTEEKTKKSDKRAGGGLSKLMTLFNADLSYGRSDVLQTKLKLKISYVKKLKIVLTYLIPEVIELKNLEDDKILPGRFYLYRNKFVVQEIDENQLMACLQTQESEKVLSLHCSLIYFSECPIFNNEIKFHSGNYAFFKSKLPITFETIFIPLYQDNLKIFGTPLYLKLSSKYKISL